MMGPPLNDFTHLCHSPSRLRGSGVSADSPEPGKRRECPEMCCSRGAEAGAVRGERVSSDNHDGRRQLHQVHAQDRRHLHRQPGVPASLQSHGGPAPRRELHRSGHGYSIIIPDIVLS